MRTSNQKGKIITPAAVFLSAAILLLLLVLLWPESRPSYDDGTAQRLVGATIFPLYDIAKNVAGDEIQVVLLAPSGASPHTFEPRPSDIRKLRGAVAVYAIGHGIDDWIGSLAAASGTEAVVIDRGIRIFPAADAETHDEDPLAAAEAEDPGHGHDGDDPHYWLDMTNAATIARNIAADLSARFPADSNSFRQNLNSYLQELARADGQMRGLLADLPSRDIVTLHDAWYYFARAYDLNVIGSFEPTAGREPTPLYLTALQTAVARSRTRTLYSEPQMSTRGLKSFTEENGLTIAELDPVGGVGDRDSYVKLMLYNARTIRENQ